MGVGLMGISAGQNQNSSYQKRSAQDDARSLARLMERQLGYADGHIDSVALRLFIRAYWDRVSLFAHSIHDEEA